MNPVSVDVAERSRKNHTTALRCLAEASQKAVAEALNTSESAVSRFKSENLESACLMLAGMGLKVVPISYKCVPKDRMLALTVLARRTLEMDDPLALLWGEE